MKEYFVYYEIENTQILHFSKENKYEKCNEMFLKSFPDHIRV